MNPAALPALTASSGARTGDTSQGFNMDLGGWGSPFAVGTGATATATPTSTNTVLLVAGAVAVVALIFAFRRQ